VSRAGGTDSERLFHHVLAGLDPGDPAGSVRRALDPIQGFTALHSLLVAPEVAVAIAWRDPARSLARYHALFVGAGPDVWAVSSEPVDGIGVERWKRVVEPGILVFRRGAAGWLAPAGALEAASP
jgi:hypothetical protein